MILTTTWLAQIDTTRLWWTKSKLALPTLAKTVDRLPKCLRHRMTVLIPVSVQEHALEIFGQLQAN